MPMKQSLLYRLCSSLKGLCSRYETTDEEVKPDPIYLLSADFEIIKVEEEDARISRALSTQFDISGEEKYAMVFYVSEVNAEILRLVLKYGRFHKGDERRKDRAKRRDIREGVQTTGPSDFRQNKEKPIPGYWDTKFMESVKPKQMYLLWEATMNLDISQLTELIIVYTAFWLRDKNEDQIRGLLDIPRDLSPEEEAEIHNQTLFLASGNN